MNKNTNLAFFTLFLCITMFPTTLFSQQAKSEEVSYNENIGVQKYKEISVLSPNERKKFFSNISATERSDIQKIHYALFLVKHPNLNKEQRELVLKIISNTNSTLYETNKNLSPNSDLIKFLQNINQQALKLFSKSDAIQLLYDLGGKQIDIDLLKKYEEVSVMSLEDTISSFAKLSPDEKSNLWRLHLTLQLIKSTKLNSNQTEIILDFISFLSAEKYKLSKESSNWNSKVWKPTNNFVKRMKVSFTQTDIAKIFFVLGDIEKINSPLIQQVSKPICMCSQHISLCDVLGSYCGGNICTWMPVGCGPGGILPCDRIHCIQM